MTIINECKIWSLIFFNNSGKDGLILFLGGPWCWLYIWHTYIWIPNVIFCQKYTIFLLFLIVVANAIILLKIYKNNHQRVITIKKLLLVISSKCIVSWWSGMHIWLVSELVLISWIKSFSYHIKIDSDMIPVLFLNSLS